MRKGESRRCSVEGCDNVHYGKGLCNKHWLRVRRTGEVGGRPRGVCSVDGCEQPHYGKGLCSMHWKRVRRTGEVGSPQDRWSVPRRICKTEGCGKPHVARGWCAACYRRWQRTGSTRYQRLGRFTPEERFWAKVAKVDEDGNPWPGGCWEWTGARGLERGDGMFSVRSTSVLAVRFLWEITYGPIPKGMWVSHDCRWWSCVNPEHLSLKTPKEAREQGWRR